MFLLSTAQAHFLQDVTLAQTQQSSTNLVDFHTHRESYIGNAGGGDFKIEAQIMHKILAITEEIQTTEVEVLILLMLIGGILIEEILKI